MSKYTDEYYQKFCLPIECPICGKKFIPAPEHYWKIGTSAEGIDTRTKNVCSYSCMRKWEKEQLEKRKIRRDHAKRSKEKRS